MAVAGAIYKKRPFPIALKVISSRLIHKKGRSKNQMVMELIEETHSIYPDSILILDRGFASLNIIKGRFNLHRAMIQVLFPELCDH